jgi:hypothetical protein
MLASGPRSGVALSEGGPMLASGVLRVLALLRARPRSGVVLFEGGPMTERSPKKFPREFPENSPGKSQVKCRTCYKQCAYGICLC